MKYIQDSGSLLEYIDGPGCPLFPYHSGLDPYGWGTTESPKYFVVYELRVTGSLPDLGLGSETGVGELCIWREGYGNGVIIEAFR